MITKILTFVLGLGILTQIAQFLIRLFTNKRISVLEKDIRETEIRVEQAQKTADQLVKEYEEAKKNYDNGSSN